MKRETYRGRKLQTTKGTDYGYSRARINGADLGRHLGNEDAAMTWMKNTIDFIDREDVNGDRWAAEWYTPGTFELCEHDHPKVIGGECLHSYCVERRPAPVVDEPAEEPEPEPSYNVFVDDANTGRNIVVFNQPRAYDASALANHFVDEGFHVDTDLWGDVVRDAMLSPEMHAVALATRHHGNPAPRLCGAGQSATTPTSEEEHMSASSDMTSRGYFARIIKGSDETLANEWYPSPGLAVDRLVDVMRAAGWPLEDTPEAEERVRDALYGAVGYGAHLDVGGAYSFITGSGVRYSYELRGGTRPEAVTA